MEHERGVDVKWVQYITITGITFSIDGISIEKCTEKVIQKFEAQLNLWEARQIILLGRSQIMKTFGFSQFRFLSNMMIIPKEMVKQI